MRNAFTAAGTKSAAYLLLRRYGPRCADVRARRGLGEESSGDDFRSRDSTVQSKWKGHERMPLLFVALAEGGS